MIHTFVSVFDVAAQAYGRPFFVSNVGVALRSFTDEVNRSHDENQLFHHPEDFQLFELGTFDDNSGRFTLLDDPKCLLLGKQAKNG